jgi:hypothetical protein
MNQVGMRVGGMLFMQRAIHIGRLFDLHDQRYTLEVHVHRDGDLSFGRKRCGRHGFLLFHTLI